MPVPAPDAPAAKVVITAATPRPLQGHLVCQVIDNFGDVGVLWRLARQLRDEHGWRISFFIDDQDALLKLAPDCLQPAPPQGTPAIEVFVLDDDAPIGAGADAVVLGFQVRLPETARCAWLALPETDRPRLIQLDYLSAETWVEDVHGLESLSPDGLREHFFYPGFGPHTGGLLLERELLATRDRFLADPTGRERWLASVGIRPEPDEILVSLLCYANAPLEALVQCWLAHPERNGGRRLHLLAPGADTQPHLDRLSHALSGATPGAAGPTQDGSRVRLSRLPFLPQPDFDYLLWSCDVNLVRGEDSWIRALWAGKPWLWQAYPQADDIHLEKLDAFLRRATAAARQPDSAPGGMPARWHQAMRAWNSSPNTEVTDLLPWLEDLPAARQLTMRLSRHMAADSADLATRLTDHLAAL